MKFIPTLLRSLGLNSEKWILWLTDIITIAIAVVVAWAVYLFISKWLLLFVKKISDRTSTKWDNLFFDKKMFKRLGWMFFPIVMMIFISPLTGGAAIPQGVAEGAAETVDRAVNVLQITEPAVSSGGFLSFLVKLLSVWTTFAAVLVLSSFLDGINRIYESYPVSRNRPIKVFIQVVVIIFYIVAVFVTVHIFTGLNLTAVLGGLAVFASVIMLIFKDSILGFVAGIQLSGNDMLRIGDWIEMPSARADGDVMEIGLVSVKVQNWDKTITTIPTYKLVSEAFTNWRGMQESDGRRIKRSVNIDVNSIRYLSDQDIENLKESALLKEYMEKKQAEINEYNAKYPNKLDERRLTNIGTFREYMQAWLAKNPDINLEMTHMVRQLQPGPTGLPLEVYCFSARQAWVVYERVQADIFDHFYSVMELFGLKAFQYPGSQDNAGSKPQGGLPAFIPPHEL